jgi:beta-galactosidase
MRSTAIFTLLPLLLGTLLARADGANLARGGTARALSVWHNSPDFVPQNAIDGNRETRWGAENRQAWFEIEWQKPQTFRGVVIRNYDAPWNIGIPFTCQVWDAARGVFRNAQTVTPDSATVVFQFPEVTTTRLRLTNVITFWEVEVYDDVATLRRINHEVDQFEVAAAGDLRGHLIGSVSRAAGKLLAGAAVEITGHAANGPWQRKAETDQHGLFNVDLPVGVAGGIEIAASNTASTARLLIDSGDLAQRLTCRPPEARNHLPLEGQWDFQPDPPLGKKSRIKVPSNWEMEGFTAETGRANYQRRFLLPGGWRGKRIKFRAEGIYSKAEVWINGRRIGSHDGGATPMELDVTSAARPGEQNQLAILVADHSDADDLSAMSYYAHFNLGGIWRPLEFFCVEPAHIARLAVNTTLDPPGPDAELELQMDLVNEQARAVRDAVLVVRVVDAKGHELAANAMTTNISLGPWAQESITLRTRVTAPDQWSAESPALYTVKARLKAAGFPAASVEQRFGFREVKIAGRTFKLNGQPIKLWGACRHDTDPLQGRAIDKATAWRDIDLMKGANLNAMRTSHYPPNPEALEAADQLGLYVEDEGPFCWVNQAWAGRGRETVEDSRLTPLFLQLASELVERDRNHPSVIIWSVCNESAFGSNLEQAHQLIKHSDPTRPDSAGQSANLDLATYHNPTSMQRIKDTANFQTPVLFDEGFCVFQGFGNQAQGLDLDPGLRDYWVTVHFDPLNAILRSDHHLGVMIWAWADDAFLVPGRGFEYGRKNLPRLQYADEVYAMPGRGIVGDPFWGLVDGWRRPRPEWWLSKKLFSPIHIEEQPLKPANPIEVPVENRNFFINLDQYACRWSLGGEHGELRVDVPPQHSGRIRIPLREAPVNGGLLRLEFFDRRNQLADGYNLRFAGVEPLRWPDSGKPARLVTPPGSLDWSSVIRLLGTNTELAYDRTSGGLMRGVAGQTPVLLAGPSLHVMKNDAPLETYPEGWRLTSSSNFTGPNRAFLKWDGTYGGEFSGGFTISMDDAGHVEISYQFRHTGPEMTAREIGLRFEVPLTCDTLNWSRQAEWSFYGADEIGRPRGTAVAHPRVAQNVPPGQRPFALDDNARGCNDFRSTKRHIHWASLTDPRGAGVKIISDGSQHIRATVGPRAIFLNVLDYYGGSATGTPEWDGTYGNGRVIPTGALIEGTVHIQLLPP